MVLRQSVGGGRSQAIQSLAELTNNTEKVLESFEYKRATWLCRMPHADCAYLTTLEEGTRKGPQNCASASAQEWNFHAQTSGSA